MIAASAALIDLLHNSTQFYMADLYTFALKSGTVLRYTSLDMDLIEGGRTFSSKGPLLKRNRTRIMRGIQVDTLEITVNADDADLVDGIPFLQACNRGKLDGAQVTLERVFMPTWGDTSPGTIILFLGNISDAQAGRTTAQLQVKSDLERLNIQMPRNVYEPSCIYTLFDTGCGLNKTAFAVAGTATPGGTTTTINCTLAQAAGYFDLGHLTFTSGANAGLTRAIRSYTPGVVKISLPLPVAPTSGDAFTAYPGCDRKQATCSGKFNNLPRFRGYPYIPAPETAY